MYLRNKFLLVVIACLCLLLAQTVFAQRVTIKLYGTDGSGITDSLTLCVDPAGTNGSTADSLAPDLKESSQGLPPPPQGVDMRVIPNPGWDGLSNYTSIHHLGFPTQTDKWKVQFQRDAAQSAMNFSWQAGLGGVGLGYWRLVGDPFDADAGVAALNVDMATTTSLPVPLSDNDAHVVYIIKGDGAPMRTFTQLEIGSYTDSKGHFGKSEKHKPYGSEACFTFTYTGADIPGPVAAVYHIEFSEATIGDMAGMLSSGILVPHTADAPGKQAKWDFDLPSGDTLHGGDNIQICYRGNKGKALAIKKWLIQGVKQATLPTVPDPSPYPARLLMKMPNIGNAGEEYYVQEANFPLIKGKPGGVIVGLPAADAKSGKGVYHPKWGDLFKTLNEKGNHQSGAAACLSALTKPMKSSPPSKVNNVLVADAIALKANIGMNDHGKTETAGALGDMVYIPQPGDPAGLPAGQTLRQIAVKLDSVIGCDPAAPAGTPAEWDSVAARVNRAYSGPFDTVSYGVKTVVKGVGAVSSVDYLYRTHLEATPVIGNPLDITKLEAPVQYKLSQNYPNPFNPTTTIEFSLPEDAVVSITVYNLLGQEVARLADHEEFTEGANEVSFDATNLSSGVYYYRLLVNDGQFQTVKKMMLMK